MRLDTLNDLFTGELRDIYNAELQMIDALPSLIGAASSQELKNALTNHWAETKQQAARLEQVFEAIEVEPSQGTSAGMAGIIQDAGIIAQAQGDPDVKDAALISAIQKMKHYEIAGYGTVRTYARILDLDDAAEMLQSTLNQEKDTDHQLTELADRSVNISASSM